MRSVAVALFAAAVLSASGASALSANYWYAQTYRVNASQPACGNDIISTDYYSLNTCLMDHSNTRSVMYTVNDASAIVVSSWASSATCSGTPVVSNKTYSNGQCRNDTTSNGFPISNNVKINGAFATTAAPHLYTTTDYTDTDCSQGADGPSMDLATGICNSPQGSTRSDVKRFTGNLLQSCTYTAPNCQGTETCVDIRPGCIDLTPYGSSGSIYYDYVGAASHAVASSVLVAALAAVAYITSNRV